MSSVKIERLETPGRSKHGNDGSRSPRRRAAGHTPRTRGSPRRSRGRRSQAHTPRSPKAHAENPVAILKAIEAAAAPRLYVEAPAEIAAAAIATPDDDGSLAPHPLLNAAAKRRERRKQIRKSVAITNKSCKQCGTPIQVYFEAQQKTVVHCAACDEPNEFEPETLETFEPVKQVVIHEREQEKIRSYLEQMQQRRKQKGSVIQGVGSDGKRIRDPGDRHSRLLRIEKAAEWVPMDPETGLPVTAVAPDGEAVAAAPAMVDPNAAMSDPNAVVVVPPPSTMEPGQQAPTADAGSPAQSPPDSPSAAADTETVEVVWESHGESRGRSVRFSGAYDRVDGESLVTFDDEKKQAEALSDEDAGDVADDDDDLPVVSMNMSMKTLDLVQLIDARQLLEEQPELEFDEQLAYLPEGPPIGFAMQHLGPDHKRDLKSLSMQEQGLYLGMWYTNTVHEDRMAYARAKLSLQQRSELLAMIDMPSFFSFEEKLLFVSAEPLYKQAMLNADQLCTAWWTAFMPLTIFALAVFIVAVSLTGAGLAYATIFYDVSVLAGVAGGAFFLVGLIELYVAFKIPGGARLMMRQRYSTVGRFFSALIVRVDVAFTLCMAFLISPVAFGAMLGVYFLFLALPALVLTFPRRRAPSVHVALARVRQDVWACDLVDTLLLGRLLRYRNALGRRQSMEWMARAANVKERPPVTFAEKFVIVNVIIRLLVTLGTVCIPVLVLLSVGKPVMTSIIILFVLKGLAIICLGVRIFSRRKDYKKATH